MQSISVLIADDELIIRRGLQAMLAKDPMLQVVGEAEDGELALELCKKTQPQLAFVDINMPFLDGLSFIEQLRSITPSTVVIVISGYDDFEYARKAIELGVFAYLLKPVKEDKLLETVADAKRELEKTQEREAYLQWAKDQLSKNKDALVSYFLHALLCGSYEEEEILQEVKYLNLSVPQSFSLFLVKLSQKPSYIDRQDWQDSLVYFSVQEHALAIFPPAAFCCRNGSSELVLLCEQLPEKDHAMCMEALQTRLDSQLPVHLDWVSVQGEGYSAIAEAFAGLEEELSHMGQLPKTLVQAQNYLAEHYWENTLSLSEVAEHAQVTSQHLSRLFKASLNVTFVEYLTMLRVQKALSLFKDSEMKIYEVAEAVGYSSQHYFCTAFKRVLHLSPQEYRKTQMRGEH